jgi:hypothetical protein
MVVNPLLHLLFENIDMNALTSSYESRDLEFRELTDAEIDTVHGGDSWAGTPEGRATADPTTCANTILAWSGIGSTVGGIGGSFITVLGGWAIGGGLAAQYSKACNITR